MFTLIFADEFYPGSEESLITLILCREFTGKHVKSYFLDYISRNSFLYLYNPRFAT